MSKNCYRYPETCLCCLLFAGNDYMISAILKILFTVAHNTAQHNRKPENSKHFRLINTIQTQMTNKRKKFSNRSRRLVYVQECCKYNNTTKMNDTFAENKLGHIEKNEIRDYKWTKQERKRWKDLRKRARKAKEVSEIRKTVR